MKSAVEKGSRGLKAKMDWANVKSQISNLALGPIMEKSLEIIYREFNSKADLL